MIAPFPDAALVAWTEADKRATFSPRDHEVIDATFSIRALIVELARRDPIDDDLYDACASLGRLVARQHGSPTLASATIDHACAALGASAAPWRVGARAAVCEGFSAALRETIRAETLTAWEFPRCAVALEDASIAIAAGHPGAEREVLEAWAARAATSAALRGIRRAFVGGPERSRRAMAEALSVAGIEVVDCAFLEPSKDAD
jgi:hypothetical protein